MGACATWRHRRSWSAYRAYRQSVTELPDALHELTGLLELGRSSESARAPMRAPSAPYPVVVLGDDGATREALAQILVRVGSVGLAVVAEDSLDSATGASVCARLAAGEVVVILAQPETAAPEYPVSVVLEAVETEGSSPVVHCTTDHGAVPSLPRHAVLMGEDATVPAPTIITQVEGRPFPDTPVIIAYRGAAGVGAAAAGVAGTVVAGAATAVGGEARGAGGAGAGVARGAGGAGAGVAGTVAGTVVGSHRVGPGRLVFCQYRLALGAAGGDAAARAILADLVAWASQPRAVLGSEKSQLPDGRQVARYSHGWRAGR